MHLYYVGMLMTFAWPILLILIGDLGTTLIKMWEEVTMDQENDLAVRITSGVLVVVLATGLFMGWCLAVGVIIGLPKSFG